MSKKSSIASASTLATIKKSGIKHFRTIFKLFNSLVQLISLDSCKVWSVSHLDSLIKVQNNFFKNRFHVPTCTPNYAVRYKLQLSMIESIVFKRVLISIAKILGIVQERITNCNALDIIQSRCRL